MPIRMVLIFVAASPEAIQFWPSEMSRSATRRELVASDASRESYSLRAGRFFLSIIIIAIIPVVTITATIQQGHSNHNILRHSST